MRSLANRKGYLGHLARPALDIIFPPRQIMRAQALKANMADQSGWNQLNFLDEPCCDICGFPFEFDEGGGALCAACLARPPAYARARAALSYDAHSRGAILAFKHGGRTEHLGFFAAQMGRAGRHIWPSADILIPVPLHKRRLIRRRFNQAALLARAVSKHTDIPYDTDSLIRSRATPPQGHMSQSQRRKNVSGAFKLSPPKEGSGAFALKGKHVVLIDDVMTTGATLEACARALRRAGPARISAVSLARIVRARPLPV